MTGRFDQFVVDLMDDSLELSQVLQGVVDE